MDARTLLRLVTVLTLAAATPPLAAQPIPIALSGNPAPGGNSYGAFSTTAASTFLPVVNDNGRVFFTANLTGTSTAGLFVGTPGSVQAVALQGQPAPAGGNYTLSFSDLTQNDAGQVAFSCSLTGGSSQQGLFVGQPGALQTLAISGDPAPGGGTYFTGFNSPNLSPSGVVAYRTAVANTTGNAALFLGTPGSVQVVARINDPSPGGGGDYTTLTRITLNATAQVVFSAGLTGGSGASGVFFGTPGSLQAVAIQNGPAPVGGSWFSFDFPVLNNAGQIAFKGFMNDGLNTTQAIYAGSPAALQVAANQGAAAPGGGTYSSFSSTVLNGAGQVAFQANLTGGTANAGIFVGAPGSVLAAARQGAAAPGGGLFSVFEYPPQLNALGQVAFVATLTGPGVDTTNDRGVYAGAPGALIKIVREGDVIDVDPGPGADLRTVAAIGWRGQLNDFPSGGQDGRGTGLSDTGFVTYNLAFTDGSSGVFVSSISAIPEPTSLALMAFLTLASLTALWYRHGTTQTAAHAELTAEA